MSDRVFRHVTADEFRWQSEVSGPPDLFTELLWLDGHLDGGWKLGIGFFRAWPRYQGRPTIYLVLLAPDGRCIRIEQPFEPAEFGSGKGLDSHWGANNRITSDLDKTGRAARYRFSVDVENVQAEFECEADCLGVKFSADSPGYSAHDPARGTVIGWWPLIPSARAKGWIRVDGERAELSGIFYIERQISTFPLGGKEGEASAQSIWTWGNFHAGDYTAGWTDSGASEQFGYRHFTPFVLWKGGEPVFSTFAFASYVEKFAINPETGLAFPAVVTLKASDGETDLFAQLINGKMIEHNELDRKRDSIYCRQASEVRGQLRRWGKTERFTGEAIHEWGTQAGNFPFIRQEPS